MACVGVRRASVRSGGGVDAGPSSSRRDAAIARLTPTREGRHFKALVMMALVPSGRHGSDSIVV